MVECNTAQRSSPIHDFERQVREAQPDLGSGDVSECLPGWTRTLCEKHREGNGYFLSKRSVENLLHTIIAARVRAERLVRERDMAKRTIPNAIHQTTPTNCFRACVATLLGIPIEDVPAACDGASWDWDAFQDWLATRGMQAIEIGFGSGGTIYPVRKPVPCIVTGESPRECTTGRHAVVGELLGLEGFRLLHDPHPAECWIDGEPTHAVFFVPIQ